MLIRDEDMAITFPVRIGGLRTGSTSAVTVTHRPTGESVTVAEHRSQWKNRCVAVAELRGRLQGREESASC